MVQSQMVCSPCENQDQNDFSARVRTNMEAKFAMERLWAGCYSYNRRF
jgi:hypothetical protein